MQKNLIETVMGAVVLAIAGGFMVFAYEGSQMRVQDGYGVKAKFTNATGLALGSDVRIGGVKVGTVTDLSLDPESYEAISTMQVARNIKIPTDSTAAVSSSGLLGEKFVQITPGADEKMLENNGMIKFTQSSVSLEELIGKFMFSGGGVSKNGQPPASAPEAAPPPATEAPAAGAPTAVN